MTNTQELLENAAAFQAQFTHGDLPLGTRRGLVLVTCMDARIDPFALLGLEAGDAHILRNAGGVATDDVIRSLAISQHLQGTDEVILIHHTDCGMLTLTEDGFRAEIREDCGVTPTWAVEAFTDLEADVRQSIARIKASPFVPRKDKVSGYLYDVHDGSLREVR
jgi:carbonic anhydrase